ncbi:hypothetical protein [Bifidobacterium felsineum]|uniref:hypothetical protein n=1 Tax=Bifidobacterium felsineum TaxID=2045440 RepID=UPI001BDCD239|nr:hypothetical protein [Bifidobacterium felsineum]MBT1163664.1 hypothetical protein [Bifidobacterium felsineum]
MHETDKRSYRVFLTKSGRDYATRIAAIMHQADATATQGMSKEEQETLRAGLRRVIANIEQEEE